MTKEQNIETLKGLGFQEMEDRQLHFKKSIPITDQTYLEVHVIFSSSYGIQCDQWLVDSSCPENGRVWIGCDDGSSLEIKNDGDVKDLLIKAKERVWSFAYGLLKQLGWQRPLCEE